MKPLSFLLIIDAGNYTAQVTTNNKEVEASENVKEVKSVTIDSKVGDRAERLLVTTITHIMKHRLLCS